MFGGAITIVGMIIAYFVHRQAPAEEAENSQLQVVKSDEIEKGQIFVPVFDEFDDSLFEYIGRYAKHEEKSVAILYIREFTDILSSVKENIDKDPEAAEFLREASKIVRSYGVKTDVMYTATADTAKKINQYRKRIKPFLTILTPHQQSLVLDFLRGNVIKEVIAQPDGNVMIYTGKKSEESASATSKAMKPALA
jgi:hypothetical protein